MPGQQRMILKASLAALLCWVLLGYPVQAAAGTPLAESTPESRWRFSKPIELEQAVRYHEFYLDEEVYGEAADDLSDLRILDGNGDFVPFYVVSSKIAAEEYTASYTSELIHTAKKGTDTFLDYQVNPLHENSDIQGNTLVWDLPKEAFLKHVQVYGSYDGIVWELLKKGDLYYTDGLKQDSLELGATHTFSYYRLVVQNNVENLRFDSMQLIHKRQVMKATAFKRMRALDYEVKQTGEETQILVHNNNRLKISRLLLESSGNFKRQYQMLDDSGRSLGSKGSGELYRLDFKDTRITATDIVTLEPISAPLLTIVIYNHDDAPIPVAGIQAEYVVDKLVFAGNGKGPYQLRYGNPGASAPQYDIVNFKPQIEEEGAALATLGAESDVSGEFIDSSSTSGSFRSKIGFNVIITAVSLLLIIVLIRKMSRK